MLLLQRPLSAASSVIDLHGVTCKLGDGRTLFEDVSLSLLANATVGIVGPNGAGKSTFLKLLAGRGADKMTDGRVSVKESVRVTYLAQEPELDEAQDVRANVALGGGRRRRSWRASRPSTTRSAGAAATGATRTRRRRSSGRRRWRRCWRSRAR